MNQFIKTTIGLLPTRLYLELKWYDYYFTKNKLLNQLQQLRTLESQDGSYKPFDEKKAIFIHIPKCAGVSINKAIFGSLAGSHTTLEQYLNIFEPKLILSYFKFTFVRNPWDRLVSAYHFLQKGGMNKFDKEFAEQELKAYSNFDDFVLNWLTPENIQKYHHFRPQCDYIFDKYKKVNLDFIGILENIEEDFQYITNKMNIKATLPYSNKSNHNDYKEYYSAETIERVKVIYADDIKYLAYNFDNSNINLQIKNRSVTGKLYSKI